MSKLYQITINAVDKFVPPKFRPLWNHPAGPKTVFFWGPVCKWGIAIAGIGDLTRSADQLSIYQSAALFMGALVGCRYAIDIIPKNYNLLSVNAFITITQTYQLLRVYDYSQQKETANLEKYKK